VRAADSQAGLSSVPFVRVSNAVPFNRSGVVGRYLEIRTTLFRGVGVTDTPILYDLSVRASVLAGIDITPNFLPNKIVLSRPYTVYVALLGSSTLDVRTVVPASVRFGRTGIEALPVRDGTLVDVNRDGRLDMLYGFRTGDCGFQVRDVTGVFRASVGAGVTIEGVDSVVVVP
jgi:hypothetical protein